MVSSQELSLFVRPFLCLTCKRVCSLTHDGEKWGASALNASYISLFMLGESPSDGSAPSMEAGTSKAGGDKRKDPSAVLKPAVPSANYEDIIYQVCA